METLSIFDFVDYREYLRALISRRKSAGATNGALAKILGCQAAYLSQVMKGRVDLSEHQLLRLSLSEGFERTQIEYLLLRLRAARAGSAELKAFLEGQIAAATATARAELAPRLKSSAGNAELDSYYVSSWLPSLIHVCTSCRDFQTPILIANRLGVTETSVQFHLDRLLSYGLVENSRGRWQFVGGSIHFAKNSPLDQQLQLGRRLLSTNKIYLREPNNVHYSAFFACDEAAAAQLRTRLFHAIEEIHRIVEPAPSKDVYSVCVDFFLA